MPCNYKAPNGKPSKLFDDLFAHYSKFNNQAAAEKLAAASWLFTRTESFKAKFGNWQSDDKTNVSNSKNNQVISELFEHNPELANEVYEALGFDKQINEIADTKKVDEFIKKYKDALPNIKDGKTLISHLQTVSNRNTGTTKQFADLIIKLSKSNKGLEKLLNNPNLYAKPNSVGDEGAFHWSLFSNLSVNQIVLELDHFKNNTYDDVFLHELIHNLTTQFIVKDSDLFNQSFYNKVKELYSVFDNHLEANKKVNKSLLEYTKNDIENLKRLKEYFEFLPSDAIQHELLFGKIGSISTVKDVKLDYKSLENKSKQDVIKELERLLSFKESRIQEIEKGDKDYYYFNSKTFKQENVLSEFLATFMNDANFREQLKNIDYKNNKSIFQSIIDLISEFIGLTKNDSLYNEFVLNLTNFINNNDYSTIAEQTQKTAYQNRINLLEQQKQQAQQLYSQYLDTIFPDSKVKDIVSHGTNEPIFDRFNSINEGKYTNDYDKGKGFWFLTSFNDASLYGKNVINALINLQNPKIAKYNEYDGKKTSGVTIYDPTTERNKAIKENKDGAIIDVLEGETKERQIVVFEPEQIHILGSTTDISGFKNFISSKANSSQVSKVVDENGEPLVVFHGTIGKFNSFKRNKLGTNTISPANKLGFFFSTNKKVSDTYTTILDGEYANMPESEKSYMYDHIKSQQGEDVAKSFMNKMKEDSILSNPFGQYPIKLPGGRVLPVFLSIKNPQQITNSALNALITDYDDRYYTRFVEHLIKENKDGVYVPDIADSRHSIIKGGDNYIAFGGNQIISIDNYAPVSVQKLEGGMQRVNLVIDGTKEEAESKLLSMQNKGLVITNINQNENVTYVSGTTERDNIYFNDDVLNQTEAISITNFLSENDSASRILKRIIKSPVIDSNEKIATQLALGSKKQPTIQLMTRDEINKAYPSVKDKAIVNMFYDAKAHSIIINNEIQINDAEFENIILEEIIHANTAYIINSTSGYAAQWNNHFDAAKNALKDAKISSRYTENSTEFLYGILRDRNFREQLKSVIKKDSSNKNFLDDILGWILSLFGFRRNASESVEDMLNLANAVLRRGLVPTEAAMMADIVDKTNIDFDADEPLDYETEKEKTTASSLEVEIEDVGENFTGNKLLDAIIKSQLEKILSLQKSLKQKLSKEALYVLRKETSLYNKNKIKELQANISSDRQILSYANLIRLGTTEVNIMQKHLDTTNSIEAINANIKLLDTWRDFANMMIDDAKESNITLDPTIRFHIDKITSSASLLYNDYTHKLVDVLKTGMGEEHVPPEVIKGITLDMTIKDIGAMTAKFIGLAYGTNPIEMISDFLIRRSAYHTNNEWIIWERSLNEHLKKVNGDMSFMFETGKDGKRRIVTRYNKELHEKLQTLRSEIFDYNLERKPLDKALAELKTKYREAKLGTNNDLSNELNDQILDMENQIKQHKIKTKSWSDYHEFMRTHFDYNLEITDEILERWEKLKEDLKDSFIDLVEGDEFTNEYKYLKEIEKYDPYAFVNWVKTGENRPQFGAMWFKATPKAEWENSSYFNGLSQNQKEFYDFFTDEFVKAQENIPQDDLSFGEYEEDKILRQFAYTDQAGLDKMKYLKAEVKDFVQNLYSEKYEESQDSYKLKGSLTGRLTDSLKFKNISSFISKEAGYLKKGDDFDDFTKKNIDKGFYIYNEKDYLIKKSNGKMIKKVIQHAVDPIRVFKDFKKLSLAYKYKRSVEDYLNTAKELTFNAEVVQETADGREIKKFGSTATAKGKNNVSERLADTIDAYLYDKRRDPYTTSEGEPGENKISLGKIADTVNNFTRVRQLGLNFASGITNLAMGTIGNFQFAARGEFFDEKELRRAYWILKSTVANLASGGVVKSDDAIKIAMLVKQFNLFGNFQEELFMKENGFSDFFKHVFIFQKGGEYMNQGAVMIAMMLNKKVTDANGKEMSMWDSLEVKNGALTPKEGTLYESSDEMIKFGNGMLTVNKEIHGDYDPLNFMDIKKSLLGRILMTFRTWMPMAIETRVGKRREDFILSQYKGKTTFREGRWRSLGRAVGKSGKKRGFINSTKFLMAVVTSTISNQWGKKMIDAMGITEEDRMNMYVNMKEAWWLMAISVTGAMFKMAAMSTGDDDREDTFDADGKPIKKKQNKALNALLEDQPDEYKSLMNYLYNQSARIDNDLWFYYNPISMYKVIRDPVAIGGTLKEAVKVIQAGRNFMIDSEKDIYSRGFRKGHSKFWTHVKMMTPIVRQIETAHSMFSQLYSDQIVN